MYAGFILHLEAGVWQAEVWMSLSWGFLTFSDVALYTEWFTVGVNQ